MSKNALDDGEYERLANDPRTKRALAVIDVLAKKMNVTYGIIGGFAVYLQVNNPPEDFPDIDIIIYGDTATAKKFVEALASKSKFVLRFSDHVGNEALFATFIYDSEIQIDILQDSTESKPKKTKRIKGSEVESLIVEKLIRGSESDIKMVLDLMAFADYDKALLSQLGREWRCTGKINSLGYFARRLAVGILTKQGISNVAKRFAN